MSGDHVGALGLAGDLAVAEKSPVNVASVERKKNLTCGPAVSDITAPSSLLFKIQISCNLEKIISPVSELKFCDDP